ncbi:hypothetical protein LEP1GSC172_1875 [Leptospira noguchii]|uniref:Uncharacterized protein n=1 Tax=Leptospira noguchii TaxID=28182 RepID=M6V926_9LEPT|nr:hypothetical protein LEP1GSC172_1875 [Leptospira noguchii]
MKIIKLEFEKRIFRRLPKFGKNQVYFLFRKSVGLGTFSIKFTE